MPLVAALLAACLTTACGDDTVEPVPPPAPVPTTITISPTSATLQSLGETVRLAATVQDQNGQTMSSATVTWASGDPSVATVDASGLVTAVANGTATVTATAGSASGSVAVTVQQAVAEVVVEPATDTLLAFGDTLRLSAEAFDANGHAVGGTGFAWVSGDTSVATVDASGLVTGVSAGGVEVAAVSADAAGRAQLIVVLPAPTTVVVSRDTVALHGIGLKTRLTAEVRDQAGRAMEDAPPVHWSSSDTLVATADQTGLVTATGIGAAIITAKADSAAATVLVTVRPPLSDREVLAVLYNKTDGPNWVNRDNWLTAAPLDTWYGVETDASGSVVQLNLDLNGLSGAIPPELGGVRNLHQLHLYGNDLSGEIPPELGNLSNLEQLILGYNRNLTGPIPPELGDLSNLLSLNLFGAALTGAIPPELGNLSKLYQLKLGWNGLSGAIPPELGDLSNLERLQLSQNDLSGSIPPGLGNLSNLERLQLSQNDLSGSIPPELGNLSNLERLLLSQNDLSGSIPPTFGGLTSLTHLELGRNAGLADALPASMIDLALESLVASATDLCVPREPAFKEWLAAIPKRWIALCGEPPAAYLVQAVQSRAYPVPLVAGEDALLRVFVTGAMETTEGIPDVRARFYLNGVERHVADIPASSTPIPTEIDEGDLLKSANAEIPGLIVWPGLEMVVEIDPEAALDASLGVPRRIPDEGRLAVEVREMPVLALTVVPFLWSSAPDSAIIGDVQGMAADPQGHALLEVTRVLLPVADIDVTAHAPVASTSNNTGDLSRQTQMIRRLEGGGGHYLGMMSGDVTGPAGLGGGRVAVSVPHPHVIAHELGHNFSLGHAPCGGAVPDPSFPYPNGTIGAWGYDFARGGLVPPGWKDHMSYCGPKWTSDYHFTRALHHRLADEGESAAALAAAPVRSLLLWGGVDTEGDPFLNPAFVAEAPPALSDSAGDYTVTGRDAGGREIFSLNFTMDVALSEEAEVSSFVFALPARPGWADALASITLSGPAGTATLDGDSDIPMAILRDPRTGQVRAFLRDLPVATQAAMGAAGRSAGRGMEVLFSRGIPDPSAWRP